MRRPLFAVLSVLVAATFASGHSAAQGSKSAKMPAKAPARKLDSLRVIEETRVEPVS